MVDATDNTAPTERPDRMAVLQGLAGAKETTAEAVLADIFPPPQSADAPWTRAHLAAIAEKLSLTPDEAKALKLACYPALRYDWLVADYPHNPVAKDNPRARVVFAALCDLAGKNQHDLMKATGVSAYICKEWFNTGKISSEFMPAIGKLLEAKPEELDLLVKTRYPGFDEVRLCAHRGKTYRTGQLLVSYCDRAGICENEFKQILAASGISKTAVGDWFGGAREIPANALRKVFAIFEEKCGRSQPEPEEGAPEYRWFNKAAKSYFTRMSGPLEVDSMRPVIAPKPQGETFARRVRPAADPCRRTKFITDLQVWVENIQDGRVLPHDSADERCR